MVTFGRGKWLDLTPVIAPRTGICRAPMFCRAAFPLILTT